MDSPKRLTTAEKLFLEEFLSEAEDVHYYLEAVGDLALAEQCLVPKPSFTLGGVWVGNTFLTVADLEEKERQTSHDT